MNSTLKSLLFWMVLVVVGVLIWNVSTRFQQNDQSISFSEFIAAVESGHDVPEPAPPVPALDGVFEETDVWRQAEDLRAYRVVREAELRDIARRAALKGVALRRARDGADKRAAG